MGYQVEHRRATCARTDNPAARVVWCDSSVLFVFAGVNGASVLTLSATSYLTQSRLVLLCLAGLTSHEHLTRRHQTSLLLLNAASPGRSTYYSVHLPYRLDNVDPPPFFVNLMRHFCY